MAKQYKVYYFLVGFILFIVCAGAWFPQESVTTISLLDNNGKEAFNLSAHWSQGNIVALIRHAERCDRSENQCLDGESGITVPGKEMAVRLGEDFKALLPLENTTIYNSPVKRTDQTAKYMFGSASNDKKWLREGCKKNLLKDIFNYKEDGENLVLVTHATCISTLGVEESDKLIKMDVMNENTYGITIFIAVDVLAKQAYVLGYLYPQDWGNLLNK